MNLPTANGGGKEEKERAEEVAPWRVSAEHSQLQHEHLSGGTGKNNQVWAKCYKGNNLVLMCQGTGAAADEMLKGSSPKY